MIFFNTALKKEKEELMEQKHKLENEIRILTSRRDKKKSKRALEVDIQALRNELADVKHQTKIKTEDIAHMVKLKEERLEIEYQKKFLELEETKAQEIQKIKEEYADKMEGRLKLEVERMEKKYSEILERLPKVDVNVERG